MRLGVTGETRKSAGIYTNRVVDLHTRRIRYFIAVAEELHFGRAAARFLIAQQAMSRQIRELERELGVTLFDRTTRSVALSPAGSALLEMSRRLLTTLDEGVTAARVAAREATGVLTVGFRFGVAAELTGPILAAAEEALPDVRVELRELDFLEPRRTFSDGHIDVAFIRTPFDRTDLRFEPLFHEPLVAAVGHRHPLAKRKTIGVADLADVEIVVADYQDPALRRYWTLEDQLGRPPARLVRTASMTEELELVSAGMACSITVAAAARFMAHPGVRYIPIDDVAPCATGLAWDPQRESSLVREFVALALEVCDQQRHTVTFIEDPFRLAT
jgi:DNA-binding transcriptional LysR family regulator